MRNRLGNSRVAKIAINGFPIEILEEIFWLVCSTDNNTDDPKTDLHSWGESWRDVSRPVSKQYYRNLVTISSVCKSWYHIACGTPRLWTVVSSFDPSEVIDRAFLRSGQCPLIVKGKFRWNKPVHEGLEFLAKVRVHVARWQEVDFEFPDYPTGHSFQSPAPCLRHFRLEVLFEPWDVLARRPVPSQPMHLFLGDAPQLETLDITRIDVRWKTITLFNNLRKLSLKAVRISIPELFSILSSCNALKELDLHDLHFADMDATSVKEGVILPHLIRFNIGGLSTMVTRTILGNVVAPICKAFAFGQRASGVVGRWNDSAIAPWFMKYLCKSFPLLFSSNFGFISANASPRGLSIDTAAYPSLWESILLERRSEGNLDFSFAELPVPFEMLAWLADSLGQPPIRLEITADVYEEMEPNFVRKIPSTTQLVLHGDHRDLTPLLVDLGTSFAKGDGVQWLFPKLRNLSFFGNEVLCTREDVLKMLEQRYAHTDGVAPPAPLDTLSITDVPPSPEDSITIEKLERLLGKNVVFWKELDWDDPFSLRK